MKSGKAGCENPAKGESTGVKGGGKNLGVKTWNSTQAKQGYSMVSAPKYVAAEVGLNTGGSKGGKQSVKGKMGSKAPAESKQVSGRKG